MAKSTNSKASEEELKKREAAKKAERAAYMKLSDEEKTAFNRRVKAAKLVELANRRVGVACAKIALIGNLGAYKPTKEQVEQIMTALGESCARVANRLEGARKETFNFTLN